METDPLSPIKGRLIAWLGPAASPWPGLTPLKELEGVPSAIVVSCKLQPAEVAALLSRLKAGGVLPWLVHGVDKRRDWLRAGCWGFLSPDCAEADLLQLCTTILSALAGVRETSPLTGLPGNTAVRRGLEERVLQRGEKAVYIDIRSFKPFNDYYGFSRGDAVIRLLAAVLTEHMPSECLAAHVGGDDFVCMGPGHSVVPAVDQALEDFRLRSAGFYDEADRAAGGIETLDRSGNFRFFEFLDVSRVVVGSEDGDTPEELAESAGRAKKALRGETPGKLDVFGELPRLKGLLGKLASKERIPRQEVREAKALVEACGFAGDRGVVEGLAGVLLGEGCADLRKSAAYALGASGASEAVPALETALEDSSPHVRSRAVEALSRLTGQRLCSRLEEGARHDSSTWVRRHSLRAMGTSGCVEKLGFLLEVAAGALGRSGRDGVAERAAALEGLTMLAQPEASPRLAKLVENPDYRPRQELWQALVASGGEPAAAAILRCLESRDSAESACLQCLTWVRSSALRSAEPKTISALARQLVSRVRPGSKSARCCLQGLRTLGVLPDRGSERRLLGALAYLPEGQLEILLEVLAGCGAEPEPRPVLKLLDRLRRKEARLSRAGMITFLRWLAREGQLNPGVLLKHFLRHPRREIRVEAARAVLSMVRRREK